MAGGHNRVGKQSQKQCVARSDRAAERCRGRHDGDPAADRRVIEQKIAERQTSPRPGRATCSRPLAREDLALANSWLAWVSAIAFWKLFTARNLVPVLARKLLDNLIAAVLNCSKETMAHAVRLPAGSAYPHPRTHLRDLRNTRHCCLAAYRECDRAELSELTLDEAAGILKVSRATACRMVTNGVIPAPQLCAGALGNRAR